MQCPHCGQQNAADATQCVRCRYPLAGGVAERSYGVGSHQIGATAEAVADHADPLRRVTAVALASAALAALVYGGFAMTARRAIFTELPDGTVSHSEASSSDRLDALLMWTAIVLIVVAAVLWLAVHLRHRHPVGTSGFTATALLGTGLILAVVGAFTTSLVGDLSDADRAALGFLIMGLGFVLLAAGCVAAIIAMYAKSPVSRPTPTAGFADWHRP
jgi:hypothetical protein